LGKREIQKDYATEIRSREELIEILGNLPEYLFEVFIEDGPRRRAIGEIIETL